MVHRVVHAWISCELLPIPRRKRRREHAELTLEDERIARDKRIVEAAARRAHLENVRGTNSAIYSSKIIKAGALIADTKTLLTHWNTAESNRANLDRICLENVFGKASRSRVKTFSRSSVNVFFPKRV